LPLLIEQHRAIVDALAKGDADEAEAALRSHLREVFRDGQDPGTRGRSERRPAEAPAARRTIAYAVLIAAYGVSRGIPRPVMTEGTLIAILGELVALPLFGMLADRIGRRPVYLAGALVNLALAAPMFAMVYWRLDSMIWLGLIGTLTLGRAAM